VIGHAIWDFVAGLFVAGSAGNLEPKEKRAQGGRRRLVLGIVATIVGALVWVATGYLFEWAGL
jgi:hypothetical protein